MKKLFISFFLLAAVMAANSQDKFFTQSGYLSFLSETPLENIFAETKAAISFLDVKTGEVAFSVPISSFQFKIKLMQEHFNENYMESGKYPKASFTGKIENFTPVDFSSTTPKQYTCKGKMNIHGTDREITAPITLTAGSPTKVSGTASFKLKPEDYGIKIPSAVFMKIASEVDITVKADYTPYSK